MKRVSAPITVLVLLCSVEAALASDLTYHDSVQAGRSLAVSITTHRPASFRVLLRVRTIGRTQLFLSGSSAPHGGPLIDTQTSSCQGAAGSFYCQASFQPLPAGSYKWTIKRVSGPRENVTFTLRW